MTSGENSAGPELDTEVESGEVNTEGSQVDVETEEQEAAENAVTHSQEDERTYRSSGERFEAFSRGLYDVPKQRRTFGERCKAFITRDGRAGGSGDIGEGTRPQIVP